MAYNEVNTVVLSKCSYDSLRGTNDRASMLLREIMDSVSIANDCKVSCLKYEYIKEHDEEVKQYDKVFGVGL